MTPTEQDELNRLLEPARLARTMAAAVRKLVEQTTCGNPLVEIRAARSILALSNKVAEAQLRERVKRLEDDLKDIGRGVRMRPV